MTLTATFTETGERREVTGFCSRCESSIDDWPEVVVSPSGVAHLQGDQGYETTRCGQNGAARGWWWHE